jgi:hypothetical protein
MIICVLLSTNRSAPTILFLNVFRRLKTALQSIGLLSVAIAVTLPS